MLISNVQKFVGDHSADLAEVKVMGSRWKAVGDGSEQGIVTLRVSAVLRAVHAHVGDVIEISGSRTADELARFKDGHNQWNVLKFSLGEMLLVAVSYEPVTKHWTALAVLDLGRSPTAAAGVRECVAIEALPADQRLARIRGALKSENYWLRAYAIEELSVPLVASREQGAMALAEAFANSTDPSVRSALLSKMQGRSFFRDELGAEPANLAVLRALLGAYVQAADAHARQEFLDYLCVMIGAKLSPDLAKDRELRAKFAAGVGQPDKSQVLPLLQAAAAANPADARLKRLAEAWSH